MVSIPCNSTTPLPTKLPFPSCSTSRFPFLKSTRQQHARRRHRAAISHSVVSNAVGTSGFEPNQNYQQQQIRTLFPGGFKRPEIKVPTLVLRVSIDEVLGSNEATVAIDLALAKGVVGVILLSCGGGDGGGGRLYEAACVLRSLIGDRAYLLIDERVDIASAVGASGVLLSDQGLPAIVARNMMSKSTSETVLLPLVARNLRTLDDAVSASSSEGADFLVVDTDTEKDGKVLEDFIVIQDVKIPIFFTVANMIGGDSLPSMASKLLQSGASGMVLSVDDLKLFSNDILKKLFPNANVVNGRMQNSSPNTEKLEISNVMKTPYRKKVVAGFTKLDDKEIQFIEAEREALLEAVAVIRRAAPLMEEISLLVDAISRLDQPFLLVIVGEFNSGKSSVINALLGRRYLKEGVVPTTNEITLLCYSETNSLEQERCERHPDGQFICYLSAPILKEMNLVDTPGTNVILQRQQRLTEEFVPRADLVLFVLSSDRPLTESEVAFLLYIQQWKKRVVFILNKADLYRNTSELEEATAFIKENVQKMISTEHVVLYPVSARSALEAKLSISSDIERNHEVLLLNDPHWKSSGFYELENFLISFLDGSTDTGMERMRLKLETPIAIAVRLLASCQSFIKQEYELACKDLLSINDLVNSVKEYAMKMENKSSLWRNQALSLVETAKVRSVKLTESILQLSNIDVITTYAFRGEKANSISTTTTIQKEIISPALSDAQKLLGEYLQWLESSVARERQNYCESFDKRWPGFISHKAQVHPNTGALLDKQDELSIKVAETFSASAAARLFEQEIREVVLGTYGGLGVAGLSASLLTSVLPTTLEDLLALTLCSTGGLIAISNFPARRKNVIEKVTRVADALAREIEEAMQEDLSKTMEKLKSFVELIGKPYQEAAQDKIDRLSEIQNDLSIVEQKLQVLKTEIQNLHVL